MGLTLIIMTKQTRLIFGQNLARLREERNLSQKKFAMMISMDRSYYISVEKGARNVAFDNIEKIAEGLQVSLSELFEGIGNQYEPENPTPPRSGPPSSRGVSHWSRI